MRRKNKYDRINKPLSIAFTNLVVDFANKADNTQEEKIMILMAREVWNISYFDLRAQQQEIESFVRSLHVDQTTRQRYKHLMEQGIQEKNTATQQIDLPDVWTRVEKFKARKIAGTYRVDFEFDYYE